MKKNKQKGFAPIFIFLVIFLILAIGGGWYYVAGKLDETRRLSHPEAYANCDAVVGFEGGFNIINKCYCSDLCPDNFQVHQVFEGVDSREACIGIGGEVVEDDIGWGGYLGCKSKSGGDFGADLKSTF